MILAILAVVLTLVVTRNLWPPKLIGPDQNFLYVTFPDDYYYSGYELQGGRLVRTLPTRRDETDPSRPRTVPGSFEDVRLFVHRTRRQDLSREVSFDEARNLPLNTTGNYRPGRGIRITSTEWQGFRVVHGKSLCPSYNIFCYEIDTENIWLEGWGMSRRLNIDFRNDRQFVFLSWVTPTSS